MTDHRSRRWKVTCGAASFPVRTRHDDDHAALEIEVGSGDTARTVTATVLSCSTDICIVSIAGRSTVVRLAPDESGCHAMAGGEAFVVASAAEESPDAGDGDGSEATVNSGGVDLDALCTPMPATVSAILVEPGATVKAGDAMLRLEAMKMELAVRAPVAGRITAVHCRAGDLVQPGRPLVALEARPASPA